MEGFFITEDFNSNDLGERISFLEEGFDRLNDDFNDFTINFSDGMKTLDQISTEQECQIDEVKSIKNELLSYSLKIVSTLVGLLGLILSISYLSLNLSNGAEYVWYCYGILLFFAIIFSVWFYLWIKNNTNNNHYNYGFFILLGISLFFYLKSNIDIQLFIFIFMAIIALYLITSVVSNLVFLSENHTNNENNE